MSVKGKVWKYGDDVNTDVIFPGKYTYTIKERADMAKVALEDLDMEFNKNAKPGDIIVYPDAPHAFHADYRPSFRKTEAEDGWKRLLEWFSKNV